jgi:hypothetical protein
MIRFASCFMMDKSYGWGTFPRWRTGLGYHIFLGPLILEYPPWGFSPDYSVTPIGSYWRGVCGVQYASGEGIT